MVILRVKIYCLQRKKKLFLSRIIKLPVVTQLGINKQEESDARMRLSGMQKADYLYAVNRWQAGAWRTSFFVKIKARHKRLLIRYHFKQRYPISIDTLSIDMYLYDFTLP